MAIFVSTININLLRNPEPVRAGGLSKSLSVPGLFIYGGLKMKEKKEDQKDAEKKEWKPPLPFVTQKSYWVPDSINEKDYCLQNIIGAEYALKYLELMRRGGDEARWVWLGAIIGDMVKAGNCRGVEIGFISTLDEVIKSYGVKFMPMDQYRDYKRSQILTLLESDIMPKTEKIRILEYLRKTRWPAELTTSSQ